jgi:hypothetical protein
VFGNIFGHHCSGTDNRVAPDSNASKYYGPRTDPDIIPNYNSAFG